MRRRPGRLFRGGKRRGQAFQGSDAGIGLWIQKIELSLHFVELNGEETIRETLRHEIAHALVGPGHGHDAVWKQKCREVGAKAERLCYEVKMPEGRWHARCGGCGMLHSRHRRPKHAGGWYCIHCGRDRGRLTWNRAG